jgi:hypothetical protein
MQQKGWESCFHQYSSDYAGMCFPRSNDHQPRCGSSTGIDMTTIAVVITVIALLRVFFLMGGVSVTRRGQRY